MQVALYSNNVVNDDNSSCPFTNCLLCDDAVIMDGKYHLVNDMTLDHVKNYSPLLAGARVIQLVNSSNDGLVYYIQLSNEQQGTVVLGHVICPNGMHTVNRILHSNYSTSFRRAFVVHCQIAVFLVAIEIS